MNYITDSFNLMLKMVKIPTDINLHVSYLYLRTKNFVDTNVPCETKMNDYSFSLYYSKHPKYMNYYFKIKKDSRYNYIIRAYYLTDITDDMLNKPIILERNEVVPLLINKNGISLHRKYSNYIFNKKENFNGTFTITIFKKT